MFIFCQQVKQKNQTHSCIILHYIFYALSYSMQHASSVIKSDINLFKTSIFQTFNTLADYGPRTLSKTRKTKLE